MNILIRNGRLVDPAGGIDERRDLYVVSGRVAAAGSVHVDPYRVIERYSHVMHIVSGVKGRIAPGRDAFDLFAACFPAGTLVGAPKVRAMEIIDELEPVRRGLYGGTIGYFGGSDMDVLGAACSTPSHVWCMED